MNNINYNDFKNICRTCLFNSDLKSIQQNNITIEILHNLGVRFETNDELPQQICFKCFEKINKIQEFVLQCNRTHSSLIKCLNNYKNSLLKQEKIIIKHEANEVIKIKEEITIEENKIEFVTVNSYYEEFNSTNLKIKEKTNPESNDQNKNCSEDDLLKPNRFNKKSKGFKCNICNKTFTHLTLFQRHKAVHGGERPFTCDICHKTFTTAGTLRVHKSIHSTKRPYRCNQCSKSFTNLHNLKRHKLVHSGERLLKCDICPKTFKFSHILLGHKRIHSGERPFECDTCAKTFKFSHVLNRHKKIHSGERPYKCDVCKKSFKCSSELIVHQRIHSNKSPFECDICKKTFKFSSNLIRHKRIHSGERPYKCGICNKGFIDSDKLKKHKKVHEHLTKF